jgi:hypothetical protein
MNRSFDSVLKSDDLGRCNPKNDYDSPVIGV